jgi:hypothetical protein
VVVESVGDVIKMASRPGPVMLVTFSFTLFVSLSPLVTSQLLNVTCPRAADIVIILDESTSIVAGQPNYDNWYVSVLGFASAIANAFPISPNLTQVGVEKFSDSAHIVFYLNQYKDSTDLQAAISTISIDGGETNIADALNLCRTVMFSPANGARNGVPKIAILVTDGAANRNADQTMNEANATKAAGIEVYTVGMTNQIDVQQLQNIASSPWQTHYFYVSDYNQLNTVMQSLVDNSCKKAATLPPTVTTPATTTSTTTTPTTTSTTTTTPSTTTTSTTTSTTTTKPTTTSTTQKSTTTPKSGQESGGSCRKQADVAFILDVTSNINYNYFVNYYIPFLRT